MNSNLNHNDPESIWQEIRGHLETKKRQIADEILHYPPPIPACDAQFNYLLEERTRISQEIDRLDTLARECLTTPNLILLVDEFLSSTDMNNTAKQEIRLSLMKTQVV